MSKTDEITAIMEGVSPPAPDQHKNWLSRNLSPGASFMGVAVGGGLCRAMLPALKKAEEALQKLGLKDANAIGLRSISGFQDSGFHGFHSWGLAIDINYATNPYIMNESGEAALDAQLKPVFDRICHLMIVNDSNHPSPDSVIPKLGKQTPNHAFYNALKAESDAMKRYFAFMQDGPGLQAYLNSPNGYQAYVRTFGQGGANPAGRSVEPSMTRRPDALSVQRQMQSDWEVLTNRSVPAITPPATTAITCDPNAMYRSAPPIPKGDRPFDGPGGHTLLTGRSPLIGYLDLSWELVNALVSAGLRWGATGFGPESGDIMHFDAASLPSLTFSNGKTVADLTRAIHA